MLKRSIAWVLVLALVLSVMPLGVLAEGEKAIPEAHSHSAAQHDCEHCDGAVTWTAWEKTDSLPTAGHYYLTADVKPTAQTKLTGTSELVLCLNGYSIDGSKLSTSTLYVQDTAKLTISDCTAYTDAEGVFHAGALKNGRAGGAMAGSIFSKHNCSVAVYNCFVTGSKVNYNSSSSSAGYGGAIHLRGDKDGNVPTLHLENVWFESNTAGLSAGALSVVGSKTKPVVTVKGCTFKNNSAPTGGAVYTTSAQVTFEDCIFTENSCTNDGAAVVQLKSTTATLDGCTIEKSTAKGAGGSAIYIHGGNSAVTINDSTIVDNIHTGTTTSSRGAVYVTNKTDKLTVTGKTVVDNNRVATDGTAVERNVFTQNAGNAIDVGGLSNGANVGIYPNWDATTVDFATAVTAPSKWNSAWVLCDRNGMAVDYNETDKFHYVENLIHEHCICGVTGCADASHEKVTFQAWVDDTKLPTEGAYYLTEDVNLDGAVSYSADVTICLNGHTVTQTKADNRVITVNSGKVIITGCKGGTITGGKSAGFGGGICATGSTAALELHNIAVTGNTAKTNGGGLDIREKAKLTMSGCTITNNESVKDGGGLYAQKETEVTVTNTEFSSNKVTNGAGGGVAISGKATLTNITVKNNNAVNGAGMIFQGSSDSVMNGGSVTGNQASNSGGGIYVSKNVTLNGTSVTGNKAKTGDGVYVGTTDVLTLTGETSIKSNDGTNLYLSGTTNVIFDKLTGAAYVGVSVKDNAARAITGKLTQDPTAYVHSDFDELQPVYKDGVVSLEAAIKHEHCLCGGEGKGCDHAGVKYAKWDKTDSLPTAGNYYLESDVVLTGEISVTGDLNLCLNGHTVKAASNKRHLSTVKNQGVTIAISDCTAAYDASGNYTAGKFTGGRDVGGNAGGGSMYIRAGSTLKIFDGIFTDNRSYLQGGAICMADGTTFEMHDGEFSDNQAVSTDGKTWKKGGAMAFYGCNATITGGAVKNNKANNGGAIAGFSKSAITITGGIFCDNWSKADGAGLYVNAAGLYVSGTAKVYDNESVTAGGNICYGGSSYGSVSDITVEGGNSSSGAGAMVQNGAEVTFTNVTFKNNTSSTVAGAIRLYKANLTMTGCTITGNSAKSSTAISVENTSALIMNGGSITNNTASDSVGGVKVDGTSSLTMTGAPVIADNNGGNLVLLGGILMDVSAMTGGEIWITADMGPISKPCSDLAQYFKSESVYRGVVYKDGALYMATDGSHKHCFCLGDSAACDHETVEWVAWESTTSLPASGNYYLLNDVVLTAEQSISSNVSICLNGHTVTAAENKRHISTPKGADATIVICDCTATTKDGVYTAGKFQNGFDASTNTGGGFAYIRTGGTLKIFDGIITGNIARLQGGAITMAADTVFELHGGEISDNQTLWTDGTLKTGGALSLVDCDALITGGTIKNNTGLTGGAITMSAGTKLTMTGGAITGNNSEKNGAGIYCSNATFDMQGGSISGNVAGKDGAGIYVNNKGVVNVSGTALISGNKLLSGSGGGISYGSTSTGKISGGIIEKNTAGGGGGLMIQNGAVVEITDGIIRNNKIPNSVGGGIRVYKATLTISGGNFQGNEATGGGAIYASDKSTLNISGGTFQNNRANKSSGGGIAVATETVFTMTGGTVKNNFAKTTGGGISSNKCTSNLSNVTVTGNSNERDGAGIYNTAGVMNIRGGVVSAYNTSKGNGGGLCYGSKSSGYVSGISIYGNSVQAGGGGAIIQGGANVTIGYASITGNTAKKTSGGIYVYKANLTMTGGVVSGNKAQSSGGGIYVTTTEMVKLSNVTITKNEGSSGGGLYLYRVKADVKDCVISENVSKGSGTGVYMSGSTWYYKESGGEFTNVKFIGNQGGEGCSGAAVYMNSDVPETTFTNCLIADNTCENYCGGIYTAAGAKPVLTDCELTGNYAKKYGGALLIRDFGVVTNCTFTDNKADRGGAIFGGNYIEQWSVNGWGTKGDDIGLTITGCTFEGNDAVTSGGAFNLDMSCYTTIDDCTFTGNTAGVSGSAMWLWENCTMTNLTVTGNVCANNGYALVLADSEFDGQTYINGLFKMGGNMIVKDNEGGDLFMDYKTTIGTFLDNGYGPKTEMHITLDEGYLTQRVDGVYNYEGGDLKYVLTYGDRSITDPEYDPNMVVKPADETQSQKKAATGDILLYAGIGVIALAAIGGAVLLISKKKKSAGAESK